MSQIPRIPPANRCRQLCAAALMLALGALAAIAQTSLPVPPASTSPAHTASTLPEAPTANVAVTNWSVFLMTAPIANLNPMDSFDNTLPVFIPDQRKTADGRELGTAGCSPIGMIRIAPDGPVNADLAIDVQLSFKEGQVLGTWPPGKSRSDNVLWGDVTFAGKNDKPHALDKTSWLDAARRAAPHNIMEGSVAESFLLYDLEANYPMSLKVQPGKNGSYKVEQTGDAPMLNLTFYKHEAAGWRTATIAHLEKTGAASAPPPSATAPHAATQASHVELGTGDVFSVTVSVPKTRTASSHPASQPGSHPAASAPHETAAVKTVDVTLDPTPLDDSKVLDAWLPILADAGISPPDQQLILKILRQYALDPQRLTAVYRVDPAELDKMLPLEIVPQPKKISRLALVIVTGIDPAVEQEMAQLVTQLGDPAWKKRDAAMTALAKLGDRAKGPLEKATHDKNIEIVYRAEELLQMLAVKNGIPIVPNQ